MDAQRLGAIEAVNGDVNQATVLELVAEVKRQRGLLADTNRLIRSLEWIEDRGRECSWCGATNYVFDGRDPRDNHRQGCRWLALWKATEPFAPKEPDRAKTMMEQVANSMATMMGNDPALPQDRYDPEKEWFFPGAVDASRLRMGVPGHGRAVGCVEWAGKARTYYNFCAGYGHVSAVWIGDSYPKSQWTEEEARSHHESKAVSG